MKIKKTRASALQLVILISVIVALLLGSFLLLTKAHHFFNIQSSINASIIDESANGIIRNLSADPVIQSTPSSLSDENLNTLTSQGFHGAFTKIESTSTYGDDSVSSISLIGAVAMSSRPALHLSDNRRPLKLVGNTSIMGDVYVSEKGITPGTINNENYNGSELVIGSIKRNNGVLPKLNPDWLRYLKNIKGQLLLNLSESPSILETNSNSFHESALVFYEVGRTTVRQRFAGNIAIVSNTEVIITKEANLTDILVIAPKVTVQSGFKGSLHILSDKSVLIEPEVTLLYPSSIIVMEKDNMPLEPMQRGEEPIVISDRSLVEGIVYYNQTKGLNNSVSNGIWIQAYALVRGEVYCVGSIELSGKVAGTVFAESFIANEFGSKHYNHIYNGSIRSNELSEDYGGLPLLNAKKTIVKWLY